MNQIALLGNIVNKPELRYTNNGKAVCKFRIAVKRAFKKDESDFINCVAFEKKAENIEKYFEKGQEIAITGSLQTGSYESSETGKRVHTADVIINGFDFTHGKKQHQSQNDSRTHESFGDEFSEEEFQSIEDIEDFIPF